MRDWRSKSHKTLFTRPIYTDEFHCYTCIDLPITDDAKLEEEYDLEDLEWQVLTDLNRDKDYKIDLIQRIPPRLSEEETKVDNTKTP